MAEAGNSPVTPAKDHAPASSECSRKSRKAGSVASSRRSRLVKSERLAEVFQAELELMDQEDKLQLLKAEHELQLKKAEMNLKRLALQKEHKAKLAELAEDSESQSVELDLPKEEKEDSIKRFLDSQEASSYQNNTPPQPKGDVIPQNTLNGLGKFAESLSEVARAIASQNTNAQQVAVLSQLPPIDLPIFSGASDEHQSKDCPEKRTCKECAASHPSCLHRPAATSEASSKCTSVCTLPDQNGQEHCMIVPVWVRHKDNPESEVLQYAILDDQSNVGFVAEGLCNQLDVKGPETDLHLTTMHNTSVIKSVKVSDLQVLDFNREQIIDLPPMYTRDVVPASRSQIPKTDVAKEWPHLESVAHKLMPYNRSLEVSLLIGNNCPRAIRPREVVAGGEDDPYGMRTALGWGIVGRICKTLRDEEEAVCHRIQVHDAYSHFVRPSKAKEVFSPQTILNALERDFNDTEKGQAPFSVNERKFVDTLEQGIMKLDDGHYEMPLPLKSQHASPPYNKPLAQKRWNQLNARFKKNPKFLADFRRFLNRRGDVRQLRSDQGTTFIGARSELREALSEMDQTKVQEYLLSNGSDWIPFELNVPHASHMGGVWERQIQTVRRVLEPLLKSVGCQLDDEAFRTFLTEAEAIINSRPLTTTNLNDPGAPEPLTPNHILLMKSKVALPPPGIFQREDVYSRKWWRRVQYAANEFWTRWKKEYLQSLQSRQKWIHPGRNLAVGDVVISKETEDEVRCRWPLARVTAVYPSKDGFVRKVRILMADKLLDSEGKRQRPPSEYDRPVNKLVLLLPSEEAE
ncbi:uncharacterized protein [Diadema setosum]|uniref:uncharacterized protein n=1 Tax=Diadema setosum TaxID=31175 RepID=UPI003B3A6190